MRKNILLFLFVILATVCQAQGTKAASEKKLLELKDMKKKIIEKSSALNDVIGRLTTKEDSLNVKIDRTKLILLANKKNTTKSTHINQHLETQNLKLLTRQRQDIDKQKKLCLQSVRELSLLLTDVNNEIEGLLIGG
jgi:hypothetical protein